MLQDPKSAYVATSNQLEVIHRLLNLLQEAGFTAGSFDAKILLECDLDQVIHAWRLLYKKLVPLTGPIDDADHAIAPIVSTTKDYHTGSSQYESAELNVEPSGSDSEDDSIDFQRMTLGPSGAAFVR